MSTYSFNPDGQSTPRLTPLAFTGSNLETSLAALAVRALIEEADLTPKPGLVDQRGCGAHADLNLDLMHRSACSLFPYFRAMAGASGGKVPSVELRKQLASIGRDGECAMYAATGGSNSHKGAIWALGLLVSAAVLCSGTPEPLAIASMAGSIARFPDSRTLQMDANGIRVQQKYGVNGARGEAQEGFPHVVRIGLPALLKARSQGMPENNAKLDALVAIMAELDDTCLLHRGGMRALNAAKQGARLVLHEGGTSTTRGLNMLFQLDAELLKLNASPGGSADLLAATLFLDSVANPSVQQALFDD